MTPHRLLARQLRKLGSDVDHCADWPAFLQMVSEAYARADEDRELLQLSIRLSSDEVMQSNVELRAMMASLSESEAKYREIIENSTDVFCRFDADGMIDMVSPSVVKLLALSNDDEVLGRSVESLWMHAEQGSAMLAELRERGELRDYEAELKRRDGAPVPVAISAWTAIGKGGATNNFAGIFRDITARKRSEETIRQLNETLEQRVVERTAQLEAANRDLKTALQNLTNAQKQLVESEKMASLGALVAGVAHEINTPVGISVTAASHLEQMAKDILAQYAESALKRASLERFLSVCEESTRMILSNLQRASDLIRSFKKVAVDRTTEERRVFNLRDYMSEVLLSLRPHLKKSALSVNLTCDPRLSLDSYPGSFSQIITNLVMNSLAHAYDPGQTGAISISAAVTGEVLTLTYSDDGKGISPESLPKIFEPFYTTRRGRGGTGLGLHILYNLVTQNLGGTVQCRSTPGQGVTFTLAIPQIGGEKNDDNTR